MLFSALSGYAQGTVTVSGTITDAASKRAFAGVTVLVKGKVVGTSTDTKGRFTLTTRTATPFTLVFSAIGFQTQEREITASQSDINIAMEEQVIMGQEVVVAASRVEETILQSPVSVEKMDIRAIRETPAANFYDGLANLKGVDMSTQSLTFKSISTRGFNANGQVRVVQQIDGMDNQAPGLNFSVGNIVGISELDLESVELLPGAASALYGPNATNGIILMNSKNPFQYQGASAVVKTGLMHSDGRYRPGSGMIDASVRYAKAFANKFAFKVNASYLKAEDWQARDNRDQSLLNGFNVETGNRENNPGYNGVNVYGDETNVNLYSSLFGNGQPGTGPGQSLFLAAIATTPIPAAGNQTLPQLTGLTPQQLFSQMIPNQNISRTGYEERNLVNYGTESLKLNAAVHYKINDRVEAILQGNYGTGTTVYTGADRYSLANFTLSQFKAELRGSNFFVRAYTTQERSGDSFAGGVLGQLINEAWKPSTTWFPQYFGAYGQSAFGAYAQAFLLARGSGQPVNQAISTATAAVAGNSDNLHTAARGVADQGRLVPGTAEFDAAATAAKQGFIPNGARFLDKTNLYHYEAMYNFSDLINFAEIVVGGNFRTYQLNSEGTLFARDENGEEFSIDEYGAYVQAARKLLQDKLKITGSIRYDKNENFKGQFTPRLSAVYTLFDNHNFRASYQTGFRIPTTQNQYIDLNTPQARLIGGLPLLRERYNFAGNPAYTRESVQAFGASVLAGAPKPALLQTYPFKDFETEKVQSYEVGYKSLIGNKLFIDAYYYYSTFRNFVGDLIVIQDLQPPFSPVDLLSGTTRNVYQMPVNRTEKIKSHGWAAGVNYVLPKNFLIGGNVSYSTLINPGELGGFQTGFNTPRYRTNMTLANREIVKNLGFSLAWRYQESFLWQSTFVNNQVSVPSYVPAYHTFDAQVSYKLPALKSIIKLGGSNVFNQYYRQAWGNPSVGALYYVSLTFDELLN